MVKDKGWYCMEELSPLKNEDLEMKFFLPWNGCCDRNESTENANESYTDLRQDVFAPVPEDMTIKKYDFFDFYVSLIQAISL